MRSVLASKKLAIVIGAKIYIWMCTYKPTAKQTGSEVESALRSFIASTMYGIPLFEYTLEQIDAIVKMILYEIQNKLKTDLRTFLMKNFYHTELERQNQKIFAGYLLYLIERFLSGDPAKFPPAY